MTACPIPDGAELEYARSPAGTVHICAHVCVTCVRALADGQWLASTVPAPGLDAPRGLPHSQESPHMMTVRCITLSVAREGCGNLDGPVDRQVRLIPAG